VQKIDTQKLYCSITQPSCLSGAASMLFSCNLYTPNSRYQCQNWSECYNVQANLIGKHGKKWEMNLSLTPSRKAAVLQVPFRYCSFFIGIIMCLILEIQYLITVLKHWSRERDRDGTYECTQNVKNLKYVNMEFLELINYSTNICWSCPYIVVSGCFFVGWFVCFFNFLEEGLSLLQSLFILGG
jgi:hypothetical protein